MKHFCPPPDEVGRIPIAAWNAGFAAKDCVDAGDRDERHLGSEYWFHRALQYVVIAKRIAQAAQDGDR